MRIPRLSATDSERFSAAITLHAGLVEGVCRRILRDPQAAADATQETFLHLLRHLPTLRETSPGAVAAWLHRAARGKAIDAGRRRRPHRLDAVPEPIAAEDDAASLRAEIDAALDELQEAQRTLLVRHVIEGVTQEALAVECGMSQPTVSRRIGDAVEALRKRLQARGIVAAAALAALPLALDAGETGGALAALRSLELAARAAVRPWWRPWATAAACLGAAAASIVVAAALALHWATSAGIGAFSAASARVLAQANAELSGRGLPQVPPIDIAGEPPSYPSIDALIAMLPRVDADLQRRYAAWSAAASALPGAVPRQALDLALQRGAGLVVDAELADALAARRETLAALSGLLEDQDLVIGLAGFLADEAPPTRRTFADRSATAQRHGLDFLTVRDAANMLAARALTGDATACRDLDRLQAAATRWHATVMDVLASIALGSLRDRVYLVGVRSGRLDRVAVGAWMAEPPMQLQAFSQALTSWTLFWSIPFGQDAAAGRATLTEVGADGTDEVAWPMSALRRAADSVFAGDAGTEAMASLDLAASVTGERAWRPDPFLASLSRWRHPVSLISLPNTCACASGVAHARNRHLAVRLAAAIILDVRDGLALPNDLEQHIAASAPEGKGGGALGFGLRYRKLSDTRFRIGPDAEGAAPVHLRLDHLRALRWDDEVLHGQAAQQVIEVDVAPQATNPILCAPLEPSAPG